MVEQHNVLHEGLTLEQALGYAAELRLPYDLPSDARSDIVSKAAENVELGDRLGNQIATLSGGQKKRASLSSETLNRPGLLYLDEVTSGLDEQTDWELMRLLRQMADDGMTIVCVHPHPRQCGGVLSQGRGHGQPRRDDFRRNAERCP